MSNDRRERLLNLVTMLLRSEGHTLAEIIETVPGFSPIRENARQEFVRDRRQLGANGFVVETVDRGETSESDQTDRWAYRISPSRSVLPDFGLTEAETAAIRQALALVDLTGEADTFALWKLGGSDPLADLHIGDLRAPEAVGELLRAASLGCEVDFDYNGRSHRLRPFGLLIRRTNWYLSGERVGDGVRTYRVDRLSGLKVGEPGAFERPLEWDPEEVMPTESWTIPQADPVDVDVAVTGPLAVWVESTLRSGSVVAELAGSGEFTSVDEAEGVVVRLPVSFPDAFRSWLLGLGSDAWVVGPDTVRRAVVDWLDMMVAGREHAPGDRFPGSIAQPPSSSSSAVTPSAAPKTQPAMRWLRRTMAMLTWLSRQNGRWVPIDELASRFGLTNTAVLADLELASVCGVPPYGVADLFEILFEPDEVPTEAMMSPVPVLQPAGPGELSPAEIIAVCTAGQVLADVSEPDRRVALKRALDKVRSSLDTAQFLRVALDTPAHVALLRTAARERRQVRIDYFAATSNRISEGRLVDPYDVALDDGRWYMDAWDHQTSSLRRFRVDRVLDVEPIDASYHVRPHAKRTSWPPADAETVVLGAPAGSAWVGEHHPATITTMPDGRVRIELAVADERWLETLLLQIGPGVHVESPARLSDLPRRAAERVLERYR